MGLDRRPVSNSAALVIHICEALFCVFHDHVHATTDMVIWTTRDSTAHLSLETRLDPSATHGYPTPDWLERRAKLNRIRSSYIDL